MPIETKNTQDYVLKRLHLIKIIFIDIMGLIELQMVKTTYTLNNLKFTG